MSRTYLTSDLSLYFNKATGNDTSGDGSATNPWASGTHSWNAVRDTLDLGGRFVTIHAPSGTQDGIICEGPVVGSRGCQSITFLGDAPLATSTLGVIPASGCIIVAPGTACLNAKWDAEVTIKNFYGTGGLVFSADEGRVHYYSMAFGACDAAHINAGGAHSVVTQMDDGSWIAGDALFHACAESLAEIHEQDHYMTIGYAGINFNSSYVQVDEGALHDSSNTTWAGAPCSGRRFANIGGIIITGQPANPNYLPGNIAGVNDRGFMG
jgi:hypothetical protein